MVARYSWTRGVSLMLLAASPVNPMMAFIGVRMSWDMLFRKIVLARFAACAM